MCDNRRIYHHMVQQYDRDDDRSAILDLTDDFVLHDATDVS